MGVEAFFYGYDETWFKSHYSGVMTVNTLVNTHILSNNGCIEPQFASHIQEIDTFMLMIRRSHLQATIAKRYPQRTN